LGGVPGAGQPRSRVPRRHEVLPAGRDDVRGAPGLRRPEGGEAEPRDPARRRHRQPVGSASGRPAAPDRRRDEERAGHVSTTVAGTDGEVVVRAEKLRVRWIVVGVAAVLAAGVAGLAIGPAGLSTPQVVRDLLGLHSSLDAQQVAIVEQLRLPRVVLGLLVGGTLSLSGASYQGVFRNPLADPYLLGAAAGAGLGVTVVIVGAADGAATPAAAPIAAFAGALGAVALAYGLGRASGGRTSTASLILAGVAVASFLTAVQTYVQQRNQDTIRQVYTWILGRLSTAGWHDVLVLLPYAVVTWIVLLAHRRVLDVLAVGDDEASTLGVHARRTRLVVIVAASLGTAAAVSVSGLIAFVGIIVPH